MEEIKERHPRRLPSRIGSGIINYRPGTLQLNQSSAPFSKALPVKRRGSFQQLKKSTNSAQQDEETPALVIVKKSTHWEKYGTVLVLLTVDESSEERESILQMLSVEGYDDLTVSTATATLEHFSGREVYPDVVIVDSDNSSFDTMQLLGQLHKANPTVAIIVLGSKEGCTDAVQSLQAGASDFLLKPTDLDELVARVERHVQRQHCIRAALERDIEKAQHILTLTQRQPAVQNAAAQQAAAVKPGPLNSVAETDFEEQMSDLTEENQRLSQRLRELEQALQAAEQRNRELEGKLAGSGRVAGTFGQHVGSSSSSNSGNNGSGNSLKNTQQHSSVSTQSVFRTDRHAERGGADSDSGKDSC